MWFSGAVASVLRNAAPASRRLAWLALGLLASSMPAQAAERGFIGVRYDYAVEGFLLNPRLTEVVITGVVPGSPADHAGIGVGDRVVEVNGHAIRGARLLSFVAQARIRVGATLRLVLMKPSGARQATQLVTVSRSAWTLERSTSAFPIEPPQAAIP